MYNQATQGDQNQEPFAIRDWSKSKLYNSLAGEYFLPHKDSRGVTRAYLVDVYQQRVFRVHRQTVLEFESRLVAAETRKSSFYSVALLYDRLEAYLRDMNQQPLGFNLLALPEEEWFSRLLRYVDPHNVLEGFLTKVNGAPRPPVFSANA